MPAGNLSEERSSRPFWILAVLLVLIFFAGGSARADVQSLQVIRPAAILFATYGLFTATSAQWRNYRPVTLILVATLLLVIVHLVPLPPGIWQQLPGRSLVVDIDDLAGVRTAWRPLSMVPATTLNALYALSVPVAVLTLSIQLGRSDHIRLLFLLTMLAIVSGTLGLLQAIGANVQLYTLSSENGGLFANRNHQGTLLAMIFPMLAVAASFGDILGLRRHLATILASALAIIAIPLVIVTGSRAGLLISLLAILLVPIILRRNKEKSSSSRKSRKSVPAIAWIGLAVAVIVALILITVMTSRGVAVARLSERGTDIRYPVWSSIVDMLPTYLPWGSGAGTYADIYQILEPTHLLRPTFSNHAHNEWLEIALTTGIPGLAIAAWAIILFVRGGWQSLRATGMAGVFSRLGVSLILMLALASTLDYPVRTPIMSSVLAIAAVWASTYRIYGIKDGRR